MCIQIRHWTFFGWYMGAIEGLGELKGHVDCFRLDGTILSAPSLTRTECSKPNRGLWAFPQCLHAKDSCWVMGLLHHWGLTRKL